MATPSLGPMRFLKDDGDELVGIYGVYVDDLINAGATFVDAPVVVDGPIITSRTPDKRV